MTRALLIACIAVGLLASPRAQQPLFRASVDGVRIDVSVMNGLTPVAGLKAQNFVVTDNGVPQTLDSVSLDIVPLNLLLLLDTSESLEGERLASLIDAAKGLVNSLREDDSVSLMTFSEPVKQSVKTTRNRREVLDALGTLVADGATSLNDAIFLGLQMRPPDAGDSRPVLLVFSDGSDTSSWLNGTHAIEATRRSGLLVHVVELVQDRLGRANAFPSTFLSRVAREGGGRRWTATSPRQLRELFDKALNELRSRYLLMYSPNGVSREGWHDVKVTLKNARGDVTARPGYFAAPQ